MKKLKAMLLSTGVMAGMTAAALAITALVCAKTGKLPRGAIGVLATAAGCLSAFLGGFTASVITKEKGALFGALSGLIMAGVIALVSCVVFQNSVTPAGAARIAAVLLGGVIGGILGVNRKKRVKF